MRWHRSRTMALPDSLNTVTVRKLANTLNSYNTKVNTKLDKKADKVTGATTGNLAALDGNGNITDSLSKPGDFATSAQGAKADTAVQSVSINGGSNLKSGTSVDIPLAVATGESGAKAGAMSSDDKKKLNDIATGAEVNQNAFSNVAANGTTIAAAAKTDTLTIVGGTHTSVVGNSADKSVTINSTLSSKTASQGGTDVSLVTTGEKHTWGAKQDQLTFDGTYNATSNKAATVSSITSRINALDVSDITSNLGVGKTITALSETDGKIAATASDIQITESQVTNLTTDLAAKAPLASPALTGTPTAPTAAQGTNTDQIATTSFVVTEIDAKIEELGDAMVYKGTLAGGNTGAYGSLTPTANKGWTYKVTTAGKIDGVAVEIGDMLICNTDNTAAATSSNYTTIVSKWDFIQSNIDGAVIGPSSTVTDASVAGFDGTAGHKIKQLTATEIKAAAGLSLVKNQAITVTSTSVSDGTNTFTKYEHPTTTAAGAAAVKVGKDSLGHVVIGSALGKSDVGLGNVVNTGDSATPVENGTDKFTTGGAYTELAKKVDKVTGKDLSTNDYTDADKNKLAGIAAGAEVNQNAFSNVKVGSTTVAADTKTDTLELVGSQHISITPDATNDKITIATDIQDQTAYSAKGSATKVPQITTNSLGQVTGITEVTISGVTPASHTHGNITNDGKIGSTADRSVVTTTGGAVTAVDMTVSSPTASGNTISFIDTVSQSSNGKISATKKTVSTMTGATSTTDGAAGLVPVPTSGNQGKYLRADGTWASPSNNAVKQNLSTANGEYPVILKYTTTATDSPTNQVNYAAGVTVNPSAASVSATTFIGALSGTADTAKAYDTTFTGTNSIKSALDGKASSGHTHGNITNAGAITTSGAIANGDSLVFVDSDDSSKLKKTSITFDGSTATKALTQKGTWETFTNVTSSTTNGHININGTDTTVYTHPTTTGNKHIPSGGSSGQILGWSADGTATWINNSSAAHGQGYASSSGSASSGTYSITMSGYELTTGGIVAIKFTQDNVASAKLNINSKGAKSVFYRGAAITAGIIQNGDIAYFMYDGTNYVLLGTDRSVGEMTDQEVSDIIDALT